tara:strand:- start:1450 stop:1635 length:186 start_codon:yes stop_codon:yes gene_type:complete
MTLGDSIHVIKEKAKDIDLNTLCKNPEIYFNDLIALINIINEMEEPTPINFKDLKNRTHLA